MRKKAELEISVNTIVVVVIALTVLGLGIAFIRNSFVDIGGGAGPVIGDARERISNEVRDSGEKLYLTSNNIEMPGGDEQVIVIGVNNQRPSELSFRIRVHETGNEVVYLNSVPKINLGRGYSLFWDISVQKLGPGEIQVYPITVMSSKSLEEKKAFKIVIDTTTKTTEELIEICALHETEVSCTARLEESCVWSAESCALGTDLATEYTSKSFFIDFQ